MCQTNLKMSSESESSAPNEMDVNEKLTSLKDKINRTTKFLKELKTLSKACQEITGSDVIAVADGRAPDDVDAEDAIRERQVRVCFLLQ
jgi:hypothetical protein